MRRSVELATRCARPAIPTLADVGLDRYPHVWASAGQADTVFRTTFAEPLKVTGGEAADIGED